MRPLKVIDDWYCWYDHVLKKIIYMHLHKGVGRYAYLKNKEGLPFCGFCCTSIPKEIKVLLELTCERS